ncbi:MAG: helix-turn-helix domain-containing protein [Longibaculum sp.]
MISFEPFFETLKRKGITQYTLIKYHNVSRGTLDALRKNKSVTLNTILDLCLILDCDIQDVVKIVRKS